MKKFSLDFMNKDAQLSLAGVKTYKKVLELSPEAIFITNAEGIILDVNNKLFEWLGYKREDGVGKSIFDLVYLPEKSKVKIRDNFASRIKDKIVSPYEVDFITRNGQRKVGRIIATAIKDENNKVIGTLGMVSDVTEHKLAEEALIESEEKWRSLVENAPNIILIVNREGIIQFINRGGINVDAKQYIGKSIYKRITPEHRDAVMKVIEKIVATGKPTKYLLKTYRRTNNRSRMV